MHNAGEESNAAGTKATSETGTQFPRALREAEYRLIWERRGKRPNGIGHPPPEPPKRVGLALSGGGIRSATFCLGVLQSMARRRLLRVVDYLSTVSGGGYIGGFLGTLFVRKGIDETEQALSDNHSIEVSWLRENGRYLAPNGAGDVLTATAVQFRNWSAVVAVMGISALMVFLGTGVLWLLISGSRCPHWLMGGLEVPPAGKIWWSPWFVPTRISVGVASVFAWGYWLIGSPSHNATGARDLSKWTTAVVMLLSICLGAKLSGVNPPYTWSSVRPCLLNGDVALPFTILFWLGAITSIVSLGMWCFARRSVVGAFFKRASKDKNLDIAHLLHNRYSGGLKICLAASGCLLVFAMIDTLGQTIYLTLWRGAPALKMVLAGSGVGFVLSLGDKLAPWIRRLTGKETTGSSRNLLALIAGIVAVLLFLMNCSVLAQACVWGFEPPHVGTPPDTIFLVTMFLSAAALACLLGQSLPFLNASSLQYLYGSRLVRAYLGASNPERHGTPVVAVTNTIPGDDLRLSAYAPYEKMGPLHIINVTFNETCDGETQLEQRDRKGLPFAIGPAGISVGARYHAQWGGGANGVDDAAIDPIPAGKGAGEFQMFPVPKPSLAHRVATTVTSFRLIGERFANISFVRGFLNKPNTRDVQSLTLGHWVAISGAAFGTGMGQNTSLGVSLLTGLANIRLGYWWDSHVDPGERSKSEVNPGIVGWVGRQIGRMFPVQSYLLDEWLAQFHGPARRHWYLSDGGHFENTAVYEFLRRRVPYIVCCDCGADPNYDFSDVANLVRKARIDFGAEIVILTRKEVLEALSSLERRMDDRFIRRFGAPEEFEAARESGHQPHAMLATVCFGACHPDQVKEYALILFLKPALSGDEPLDLWEYRTERRGFPQEPTTEQFFDEAQWESYRRLGQHIADAVLTLGPDGLFWLKELAPERVWNQFH